MLEINNNYNNSMLRGQVVVKELKVCGSQIIDSSLKLCSVFIEKLHFYQFSLWSSEYHKTYRLEPIMLLKLPIILLSNTPKFPLLYSNYAQLCLIMPQVCS